LVKNGPNPLEDRVDGKHTIDSSADAGSYCLIPAPSTIYVPISRQFGKQLNFSTELWPISSPSDDLCSWPNSPHLARVMRREIAVTTDFETRAKNPETYRRAAGEISGIDVLDVLGDNKSTEFVS